jgi:predicted dehydrogenase
MNSPTPRDPGESGDFNRRDFLKGSSLATLVALMGGTEILVPSALGQENPASTLSGVPLKVGVIGCGVWGREILNTLARLASADVVAICDTYPAMLRRSKELAPKAENIADYRKILAHKEIPAVIIATPSHQHKDLVIEALDAGKQVYCEAPLAHRIEDARAIAIAAKKASSQYFQPGLSLRSDPQRAFLVPFLRAGAAGRTIKARTQWHKKDSLRRASANAAREKELNWRLSSETSPGLLGEFAVHQLDNISWFLDRRPTAVTGFGSTILWNDGRDTPDSVMAVYEYARGALATSEVTLGNSFDSDFEMLYGTDAAVMLRGNKAWMFKEVDAPLLGWEVYARKDTFYKETGIALVANATKLKAQGDKPIEDAPFTNTPLYYGLEAFIWNADIVQSGVKEFEESFGTDDKEALAEALKQLTVNNKPAATWQDGYDATVAALKGTEAVKKKARLEIPEELFAI